MKSTREEAKRVLRSPAKKPEPVGDRPEGFLVRKISDKAHVRVSLSDFTGEECVAIQKWFKRKDGTWSRASGGLFLPVKGADTFARELHSAIKKLLV